MVHIFSRGFRPFFLGGAIWAGAALALWVLALSGVPVFDVSLGWHMHEMLFGYVPAVMAGFLLTAVPNWTGRPPLQGAPLVGLFVLWFGGRVAFLVMPGHSVYAMTADVLFLPVLAVYIGKEIWLSGNKRNLKVLAVLAALTLANITFHAETYFEGQASFGLRGGVAAILAMILIIGGRIVPTFTGNWLRRRSLTKLPPSFGRFDLFTVMISAVALLLWFIWGDTVKATGFILLLAGAANMVRLFRWLGIYSIIEPLVYILHIGFGFIPLGFFMLGLAILWPELLLPSAALHSWLTGAIGVMTLAVMTRATLGHTGRPLEADGATQFIYVAVFGAALARVAVGFMPDHIGLLHFSAAAWVAAFGLFAIVYGRIILARPNENKSH